MPATTLFIRTEKGNDVIDGLVTNQTAVNGLVVRNNAENNAPFYDDSEQNILKITNNVATAYGYLSSDITLSANTVYAFSVLAKTDSGAKPFFYVVRSGADSRSEAVIGKIEASAGATVANDEQFGMVASSEEGNGWARYYIVIATGDEGMTVRVALFNGSIDGSQKQQGHRVLRLRSDEHFGNLLGGRGRRKRQDHERKDHLYGGGRLHRV